FGLMLVTYFTSRKSGVAQPFSPGEVVRSFYAAGPALLLPVIIVGGILAGIFTPTESAAIALVYAIAISMLLYRSLTVRKFLELCAYTGRLTGVVLLLLAFANVLAWLLTANQVPQEIVADLTSLTSHKIPMLAIITVTLLIVGFFM